MRARLVLFSLLLIVAGAAAVLSFAALRDLALICGFNTRLAWLLPVVVDAGAAAGSLVWLGGWAAGPARRFARVLALGLLALSVAANALGHGLAAYALSPPWWVVVIVSAVAPAVLGAFVHLAVLVGRPDGSQLEAGGDIVHDYPAGSRTADAGPSSAQTSGERAAQLIEAGAGRRRLSRELDITEYEARQLIARSRSSITDAGGAGAGPDDADTAAPSATTHSLNGSGDRS